MAQNPEDTFSLDWPDTLEYPLLISVPHCGTRFPDALKPLYKPSILNFPTDTDWYVDQLYSFAEELNVPLLKAKYSRYVIDLNRSPENKPLYNDNRPHFPLVPTHTFLGESLFADETFALSASDIEERKQLYFTPYHNKLSEVLQQLSQTFTKALLVEAHSIPRKVATIHPTEFPDIMLGTNDKQSMPAELYESLIQFMDQHCSFDWVIDDIFKGGFNTRNYANSKNHIYSLQIELSQDLYLNNSGQYDVQKSEPLRAFLFDLLQHLLKAISL